MPDPKDIETHHASCVAHAGRAVLIRGASGAGKSALALELMARGATLVADDRVRLWRAGAQVMADAPDTIRGLIEARGVGILRVKSVGPVPITLVVDLDRRETERLPERHEAEILGVRLNCLHNPGFCHFSAAILAYLSGERHA